ncbi:unnamed protein product [Ceutorhynchus assimilis]|uniref:Peptidase S1 domain-containing protein n=1 Tax=Ceutorhynchus assimilis TaxID=467358 RepID=A0A9N9MXH7_9CUCU|nr:unnamed protein product [Ceutorhynchus assimilis]
MANMIKLVSTIGFSVIFAVILNEVTAKPQHPPLKIVNGTTAKDGEFPYMVQLLSDSDAFFCGGSIIGDRWILTAGHCVEASEGGKVVYGTNLLAEEKHLDTAIKIKKSYLHPLFAYNYTYGGDIPYFDVGILELEHAIPFDAKAQPVQLANSETNSSAPMPFHQNGTLSGWGVNETFGAAAEFLQKINLQLLNDTECARKIDDYVSVDIFNSTHNLCSDDYYNGECFGDSGSPFVVNGLQYGVVSWSFKPCGITPGTYSRLTTPAYREFIRNVTGI